MPELNPASREPQSSFDARPPIFGTMAAVITGVDEAGIWHGRAPRGNGADPSSAYYSSKDEFRAAAYDPRATFEWTYQAKAAPPIVPRSGRCRPVIRTVGG
jgi:hypothetical protein